MNGSDDRCDDTDLILAIDNGTQSVRALLFDLKGTVVCKSKVELDPYFSREPGWAEQEPEYYWSSLCAACQSLWEKSGVDRARIKGVTLTTQRGTNICVDKNGQALRPAIIWLDQRRAETHDPIGGLWGPAAKITGLKKLIDYFRSKSSSRWIAQNELETWGNTHKFLLLSGWHTFKLTGEFKDSVGGTVGYLPFNYRLLKWAPRWDWSWRGTCLRKNQLAELIKPGEILGHITASAADATGIPEGLPLIAAGADKACEVIGSGCYDDKTGCLSYGTTATINVVHDKFREPQFLVPPWPAAIPDTWNSEFMVYRGYWMVSWFKQQFGHHECTEAEKAGVVPEELFEDLINQAPPGSMGLMLQPYWSPGIKDFDAKGAIIGFGDVHNRAHVYRAIVEGLAYALREGKEKLEKKGRIQLSRLMVSGGGSQSDGALQLTADIFNLPVTRPHTSETSGLGAAINAAVGLGYYPDYKTAITEMTRPERVFKPDPVNTKLYNALYTEVYLDMYKRLRPLYGRIREITGYPE
ncbi:FGGY-family carbohydrate kinase [Sansalvadorimonas sp. 2012CJ34-2]|uniref:FGGY-family carbohydrate kinase n=1 Tax=Parendozoicomonas callyspongiae TaxID=2942213 RepID=A0ABT0PGF3_9GAMM|nr:FGGY-family carbohydrate kinase [Sansalvadorimonas sp. 2012CJ34-2]MCL6270434.1 FGGY-family carbohydrate kinase [Sansalvadorimonas sp. 2012CJ34-2]